MSQENVDRFVEFIGALNRVDIPGPLRFMDPEIRFEHRVTALQGVYTGLEDVAGAFADFTEHFETPQIRCADVRDLGDRVLALGTTHAIGVGSGVETELPFTVVASFRDGRITHFTDFGDRAQALEAAGLQE